MPISLLHTWRGPSWSAGCEPEWKKDRCARLHVQHFNSHRNRGCQILFIGESQQKRAPSLLTRIQGNPILTVGDTEHFVQDGGMIGFLLEENKIRFEINLEAAEHAKLRLSSRLLALAKRVLGGQRGS